MKDDTNFNGNTKKLFDLSIFNRVRSSDPITSHEAADAAKDLASKHFGIIVGCLKAHGALGKDGIATHSGLEPNQVARRFDVVWSFHGSGCWRSVHCGNLFFTKWGQG